VAIAVSATYFYLADSALLVTGYWGVTNPAVSQVLRDARAADPARPLARAHVIDLSFLEGTVVSPSQEAETFRSVASSYAATFGDLPTAVIAATPHVFGLARIFEIVGSLQSPPLPIRALRSWQEAEAFLGLDLTAARAELEHRRKSPPAPE
jgi:hypothetical protein